MDKNHIKNISGKFSDMLLENLIAKSDKGRLLKVNDVAQMLAVSPRTVRHWVYVRAIPFLKINGTVRFAPEALEKWVIKETHNGNMEN